MASRRIQGITVEINGDTTKLNSALKSVDKSLASTQSQLKDVEKLLKLDPKNTELLAQKQKLLKDAVGDTKDRLEKLKAAAAELATKDSTPEMQKQQDALQREIIATENQLKEFETELGKIPNKAKLAFDAIGDGLTKAGEKITEVGEGLTKNVTAPIAAVGAASVAAFNDVDDAMDEVILKTGATGESAKQLQGIVENLATTIPTDFQTAANAVGQLNTKFGVTGEALEDMSAKFIKFASVNKKDVSSSVDSVQKAMSAFGLSADKAGHFLDVLTDASQRTGADVDSLTNGIVQNATAFQEMGLSVDQAVTLMAQMERSGANSETVMNGLRKALKNATKEGRPLSSVLNDLEREIKNSNDQTKALNDTYELFGKSGDQIYSAIRNGTLSFQDFGKTLETVGGTVDRTFDATVDGIDNWKMAMNEVKLVGADIGGILSEFAGPILKKVRDALQDALQWWRGLSDEQQKNIIKIGGIVAAIGPMVTIIGKATSAVGLLSKGLGVLAAHPVAAAFIGLGVAIGGTIVAINDHVKAAKEAAEAEAGWTEEAKTLHQAILDEADAYAESVSARQETFTAIEAEYGHLHDLAEEYDALLDSNGKVKKGYEERAEFIKTTLADALGLERDEIDKIIQKNGELTSSIDEIIEKRKAEAILNQLESDYAEAIVKASSAKTKLAQAEAAYAKQAEKVRDLEQQRLELEQQIADQEEKGNVAAAQLLRDEYAELSDTIDMANGVLNVMSADVEESRKTYEGYQTTIKNYEGVSSAVITGDANRISKALEQFRTDFKTTETATKDSLERQYRTIDQEYKNMVAAVEAGDKTITQKDLAEKRFWRDQALLEYSKATQDIRDAARNQVNAYASRMKEGERDARTAAASVGGGAKSELEKASSGAYDSGYNFTTGFAQGITAAQTAAVNSAKTTAQRARDKMNQILGIRSPSRVMEQTGEYFTQGFALGIREAAKDAISAAQDLGEATASAVSPSASTMASANPYIDRNVSLVDAFKTALSGMRIDLDDHEVGAFVESTVANAVYAR